MPSEATACEVTISVGGNKEIKHWKYNANGELCLLIFNLYFFLNYSIYTDRWSILILKIARQKMETRIVGFALLLALIVFRSRSMALADEIMHSGG